MALEGIEFLTSQVKEKMDLSTSPAVAGFIAILFDNQPATNFNFVKIYQYLRGRITLEAMDLLCHSFSFVNGFIAILFTSNRQLTLILLKYISTYADVLRWKQWTSCGSLILWREGIS